MVQYSHLIYEHVIESNWAKNLCTFNGDDHDLNGTNDLVIPSSTRIDGNNNDLGDGVSYSGGSKQQ